MRLKDLSLKFYLVYSYYGDWITTVCFDST